MRFFASLRMTTLVFGTRFFTGCRMTMLIFVNRGVTALENAEILQEK
jgi:hypothetical protein